MGGFSCYFCHPKHDYAVTVAVCSLHKDMFSVLKERGGGGNLRLKSVKWMKNNNNSSNNKKKSLTIRLSQPGSITATAGF